MLVWTIGSILLCVFGLHWYNKQKRKVCTSSTDLSGKTVIITGANSGIGYETALDLAKRNGKVILACRNLNLASKAKERIIGQTGNDNVKVKHLDLSSLKSVRQFAKEINEEEYRLDILVNNAALAENHTLKKTADGLDLLMATNYFGPFLLTNLLLDLLKKSSPSRIVNVSSIAHRWSSIDFENLNCEKYFPKYSHYASSKLANIIFSNELARRVYGTGVTSNSLHPGFVMTNLFNAVPWKFSWIFHIGYILGFLRDVNAGAQTSIYCAVSEEVEGVTGKYLFDCKIEEPGGKQATDPEIGRKLWEISAKITGLT